MIPVIISGGAGSRLWPVSRQSDPKPFLKLSDGKSLLQSTFVRAVNLNQNVSSVITVTNEKLHFRMQDEYQQVNDKKIPCDFVLEPFGRNTAPAVIAAALFAKKHYDEDEILLILPADHLISDLEAFTKAVADATEMAKQGFLVTFGINPEYPETGYGYIEANKDLNIINGYEVKRFVEKPDLKLATEYVESGNYQWNSGMFCGQVKTFLEEFSKLSANVLKQVDKCINASNIDAIGNSKILHLNAEKFIHAENISVDYALFEKTNKAAVIPCSIGWSDIGSWLSIAQTLPQDKDGNATIGESILHNVSDCLVYSTNRIVAGVDIKDLVIVDTPDALLVASKEKTQDVKHIFERLKKTHHKTSDLHQTIHRPWGTVTILEEGPFYKINRLVVKPGQALSNQSHEQRSEHWIVLEGEAVVINEGRILRLAINQSTYISQREKHRLMNASQDENLVIIEVQCGNYLGEDDITRYDDLYGRN
ncbi:MAG: mannose-1-phosphate guanylyltransferase/mannose-6-phosphate isomerase [Burkholderiales bacterium]|nr:mannose-1-phosphate guanylyltransferase/mannose-6-phosphate isomerase [Burkholderiales bacterium]